MQICQSCTRGKAKQMGEQLLPQAWGRWTRRQIVRAASRSHTGPQTTQQGGWVPAPTAFLSAAQSSEELQPSSGKWGEVETW